MYESTPIVAFDQHAGSLMAAVLLPGQATPAVHPLAPDLPTVVTFLRKVAKHGRLQCCYEAGPGGFALHRGLTAAGLACDVIAPSLIPRRPGDRIKTDRRDARQLAILYRAGTLTRVHVPSELEEAVRDLLRCREDAQADLVRARHRLSKCLLRHGRRFTGTRKAWTRAHLAWVRTQTWTHAADTQTHQHYVRAFDEAYARLAAIDADVRGCLVSGPVAARAARLRCFRGIDEVTALTLASELSDPRRFATPRSLMAFVGLVPSEHSSGGRRAQGGITKTGNAHARRVLVEASWHYRHLPFVGQTLRRRQAGQPADVITRAWTAQVRLHKRTRQLLARGKPRTVVVTAVARELTGFLWAALVA